MPAGPELHLLLQCGRRRGSDGAENLASADRAEQVSKGGCGRPGQSAGRPSELRAPSSCSRSGPTPPSCLLHLDLGLASYPGPVPAWHPHLAPECSLLPARSQTAPSSLCPWLSCWRLWGPQLGQPLPPNTPPPALGPAPGPRPVPPHIQLDLPRTPSGPGEPR